MSEKGFPGKEYASLAAALKKHIELLELPKSSSVQQLLEFAPETEGGTFAEAALSPRDVRCARNEPLKKNKKSVSFSLTHMRYSEEKALAHAPRSRSPAREMDMRLLPTQIYFNSENLLGGGTFGEVYFGSLTKECEGRLQVAIKVAEDDELLHECLAESAAVMAKIHSNAAAATGVVDYFGSGYLNVPGEPLFLVTELSTTSLRKIVSNIDELNAFELRLGKRFDLAVKLKVLVEIVDAIDALHRIGVVHKNLKPENVLLRADGTAKLTDVGLALPTKIFRETVSKGEAPVQKMFYTVREMFVAIDSFELPMAEYQSLPMILL